MGTNHPLGLYVHLPWCVAKCPYCDFNSHGLNGRRVDEAGYTDALLRDLSFERANIDTARPITSVFFGGGTPSLFSPPAIARVLETAEALFGFDPNVEITLEANPGASDAERFAGYRAAGVNRLSIGVQSFDDTQLRRLGRRSRRTLLRRRRTRRDLRQQRLGMVMVRRRLIRNASREIRASRPRLSVMSMMRFTFLIDLGVRHASGERRSGGQA